MSQIKPHTALEVLYRGGRIPYERMKELSERSALAANEAMEAIESSPAFLDALSALTEEIERRIIEQDEATTALLSDPRYAQVPEVTGVFVKQFWVAGDYLTEIDREDFTVPLPYLVANRERLEEVRDFGDSDWLALELGLNAGHYGPFDITDIEESLTAWLKATEVQSVSP